MAKLNLIPNSGRVQILNGLILFFLPNEKQKLLSLLAERVKQFGKNKLKSIGSMISQTAQTTFYCC